MSAASAASSGSNGSPATAAPSSTRRISPGSSASSPVSAAATAGGTSTPASATLPSPVAGPPAGCGERGELLEVEGVALALLVKRRSRRAVLSADQLASLVGAQRADLDGGNRLVAARPLEGSGQPLRHLARTHCHGDQHRRAGRPPQQRSEQLDRPGVGPVEVVEHQHERLGGRERLEELAHGGVSSVTVVLWPRGRLHRTGERGQHVGELGQRLVAEGIRPARFERLDVLVEGVHEHPEGQLALELGSAAGQDEHALRVAALAQLRQKTRLPDPRLTEELQGAEALGLERRQRTVDHAELSGAPNELLRGLRHGESRRA
jgi:hypothetical protein